MAAQYASMEEAEADAKEYIETTVKKAFDHLQPIEDTNEPYKAGDLVLCVQEGVWYPSSLVEQSSRSKNRIHVPIFKVHFDGWAPRWDEWVESDAGRLKRRTAENLAMARASLQEAEEEAAQERLEEVRQRFAKQEEAARRRASGERPKRETRASHPPYNELVCRAVYDLKESSGSSVQAVAKWLRMRYPVNENKVRTSAQTALKKCVAEGSMTKIRNSFKLSPREQRRRDVAAGVEVRAGRDGKPDDLDVEISARQELGYEPPPVVKTKPLLSLAPADCASDAVCVAEFCERFDVVALGGQTGRSRLTLAELDAALAALPDPRGWRTPPLLARLALALLRVVCGRDPATGDVPSDPRVFNLCENELFVGHRQNRRVWGHALNALTWADIFRRHLLASQRHRRRARDAFPAPYVPKPPKWKHPDRAAADLAIAAAAAKIAARKKAEAERRAQKKREEERRRAAAAEDEEARKLAADPGAAAIREAYAREQAAAGKAPPAAPPPPVAAPPPAANGGNPPAPPVAPPPPPVPAAPWAQAAAAAAHAMATEPPSSGDVLHERGGGGDDAMDVDAPAAAAPAPPAEAAPAPAPAPQGKGVSADGRKALEACWALEFPALADPNPFRTRLSQEICEEIGCPDYHEKCPNVADLALCKEKLESYADDESLKKDIKQIALNSSTYHGPVSPFTQAAERLVRTFERVLRGEKPPPPRIDAPRQIVKTSQTVQDRKGLEARMDADGWTREEKPRPNSTHVDKYFLPPNGGRKLRSIVEVARTAYPEFLVESGPRKSHLPRAKRVKIEQVPHYNRFPFDDAVDSDDGALAEAIYLFAEKRRSFAALQPRHAAALLKHLCDDALLTPALQEAIRRVIDGIEDRSKEARQAARRAKDAQKQLNDCDDPERAGMLNDELLHARADADRCAEAIDELRYSQPLRNDMLGDDRRWSRYFSLKCDAPPSLVVRVSSKDDRAHPTNIWRTVEEGPLPVRKNLDCRGHRENHLAEQIDGTFAAYLGAGGVEPSPWPVKEDGDVSRIEASRSVVEMSRCASLPWPGSTPQAVAIEPEVAKPVSSRIRTLVGTSGEVKMADVDAYAQAALEAAAPWRCQLNDVNACAGMNAAELDDTLVRIKACNDGEPPPAEVVSEQHPSLSELCDKALEVEAGLYELVYHGREALKQDEEPDQILDVHARVEKDLESERDYFEIVGACSDLKNRDVGKHRDLWRAGVSRLKRVHHTEAPAAAATFQCLYQGLREQVAKHLGPLEARVKAAHSLLASGNAPTAGTAADGAGAVYIPSKPTGELVWARIRGYPWWPARRHEPTRQDFKEALQARGRSLIVFVGESVQYFMPSSGLAEFSGVEGDVHLPKPGKATPQLAEAIRHARTSVGVYYDPISKVYKKGGRGAPEALAQAAAAAAEAKKQSPGRKRTIKEILGSW